MVETKTKKAPKHNNAKGPIKILNKITQIKGLTGLKTNLLNPVNLLIRVILFKYLVQTSEYNEFEKQTTNY
ncbi:hypothetical protein BGP_0589 [Beggiatoa sp. PS]|nr:hypothetical protein BGP_0589 [Beggiatoa sp. PS]